MAPPNLLSPLRSLETSGYGRRPIGHVVAGRAAWKAWLYINILNITRMGNSAEFRDIAEGDK